MTPGELTAILRRNIPLLGAVGVEAVALSPEAVTLRAPLAANLNHHGSAFGGSLALVAIIAGWSMVDVALAARGRHVQVMIQRSEIKYLSPVTGDFLARTMLASAVDWQRFEQMLDRRGRGRVTLVTELLQVDTVVARHTGTFAASLYAR